MSLWFKNSWNSLCSSKPSLSPSTCYVLPQGADIKSPPCARAEESLCTLYSPYYLTSLQRGQVPQFTKGAPGQSQGKKQPRSRETVHVIYHPKQENFEKGRETVNLWWNITLGLSPAILLVTQPISGTASAVIHVHVPKALRLHWSSLKTEGLNVPLSLWLPPCQHGVASPHLFQDDQCPDGPLFPYSWFCGRHWPSHKA